MLPLKVRLKLNSDAHLPIPYANRTPNLNNNPRIRSTFVGADNQIHVQSTYADGRQTDSIKFSR